MFQLTLGSDTGSDSDTGIGLIHCNNINSSNIFASLAAGMRATEDGHLLGPDGKALLLALQLYTDGNATEALAVLNRPLVAVNRTSNGGSNAYGDVMVQMFGIGSV
jgi:hypothetical protein